MSTTRPTTTRAVHLASRPHGAPTEDNFRIEEISLPELSDVKSWLPMTSCRSIRTCVVG